MTRREFIATFGTDPEDMFGPDWRNVLTDLQEAPREI